MEKLLALVMIICGMITPDLPLFAQVAPLKISFDGEWLFAPDSQQVGRQNMWYDPLTDRSRWITVRNPSFWETFPGCATYDGWGWFARTFPFERTAESMSLHFGGVDDDAVVWVNGIEVGSHTGYSEPFSFDITHALRNGQNALVVLVEDHGAGGGMYGSVTLVETRHAEDLLKSPYYGTPARKSADWVKDAVIYEVYLRSFSREGTFAGLETRVPELKALGVTVLWLMPIHPVGREKRKGVLGSPYAVQDYYGINPEFGRMEDFKKLLSTVHKHGMKLIIDLVVNHTAWDSKLMTEHPEWFTKDSRGRIVSPNDDWTDVADLDYSHPALRHYMIEMMRWWVKDIGIDGFRCDVAELVPTDFWENARERLDRIKPVMMISEGSLPEHHKKAFDLTYSWNIYDVLEPLLNGKQPVTRIDDILRTESLQFPTGALRMRFTTNHDKNAWDAPAVTKFGPEGLKLSAVLVNTIPGVPMLYTGEEVPNDKQLGLFEKVDVDWDTAQTMRPFYTTMFKLRTSHKALSRGEMIRVSSTYENDIYAFVRVAGRDKVLVVLNFSEEPRMVNLQVPVDMIFPGRKRVPLREVFTNERWVITSEGAQDSLRILTPYDFKIFVESL